MQCHCVPKIRLDATTQCPGCCEGSGTFVFFNLKASLAFLGKTQTAPGQAEPTGTRTTPLKHNLHSCRDWERFQCHFRDVSFPEGHGGMGNKKGKEKFLKLAHRLNPWKWVWGDSLSPQSFSQEGESWNSDKNTADLKLRTKTIQKG